MSVFGSFRRLSVFVLFIVIAIVIARYCLSRPSLNKLHSVVSLKSGGEMMLDNGVVVKLAGISMFNQKLNDAKARINQLVNKRKVIVCQTDKAGAYDVLIWGSPRDILGRDAIEFEVAGAKNVDIGFLNVQQGSCVDLNEVLINEGFARRLQQEK